MEDFAHVEELLGERAAGGKRRPVGPGRLAVAAKALRVNVIYFFPFRAALGAAAVACEFCYGGARSGELAVGEGGDLAIERRGHVAAVGYSRIKGALARWTTARQGRHRVRG